MRTNSVRDSVEALRQLVAFAEGETSTFPVLLVKAGDGLVSPGSDALKRIAVLTPRQIEVLQLELRTFLRAAAAGDAHMTAPMQIKIAVITHAPDTPPTGRRAARSPRAASLITDGDPRSVLFDQANRVLPNAALEALQVCPDPKCGKAFVRVTQKRFCSTRCQTRTYKRKKREDDRRERAALSAKGVRYGQAPRSR